MLVNMVGALNNALIQILHENPNAVVLGEDVGKDGGVFRVTDGLLDKFGPGLGVKLRPEFLARANLLRRVSSQS